MSQINMKGSFGGKMAFEDTALYRFITGTVAIVRLLHLKLVHKGGGGLNHFFTPRPTPP